MCQAHHLAQHRIHKEENFDLPSPAQKNIVARTPCQLRNHLRAQAKAPSLLRIIVQLCPIVWIWAPGNKSQKFGAKWFQAEVLRQARKGPECL